MTIKNITFETIPSSSYKAAFEALNKLNNETGPLVENMVKYFASKNPLVDECFFKKAISSAYLEQSKIIANLNCNNKRTKIVAAFDKNEHEIMGIAVLLHIGQAKNNINIYEACNFGVSKLHQGLGIGAALCNKILNLAKNKKCIIIGESINPIIQKFLCEKGFKKASTANDFCILRLMDVNYSPDWFLFKEFNIENTTLKITKICSPLKLAWDKGWKDWANYD